MGMFDIKSFHEARDVKDAVEALVREPEAEIISGGTDVLHPCKRGKDAGRALVSIHNIKELKGVKVLENGDLMDRIPQLHFHILQTIRRSRGWFLCWEKR